MNRFLLLILGMVLAAACTVESDSGDNSSGDDDGGECRAANDSLSPECLECSRLFCCAELESCENGSECQRCSDSEQTDCTVDGMRAMDEFDACLVESPGCDSLCYGCFATFGTAGCNDVVTAWCEQIVECCVAEGCAEVWGYDVAACRSVYAENGYACDESPYRYTTWVCENTVDMCLDEVRLLTPSCDEFFGGTATWGAWCQAFWAQF